MAKLSDRLELIYDLLSTVKGVLSDLKPYLGEGIFDIENEIVSKLNTDKEACPETFPVVQGPSGCKKINLTVPIEREKQPEDLDEIKIENIISIIETIQNGIAYDKYSRFDWLDIHIDPDNYISVSAFLCVKEQNDEAN